MIKAAIFDLDGVIVSTDELHYKAWKKIADNENIYFDRNINERLRGVSRLESLEIILEKSTKKYTSEEKEELAESKNKLYREYLNDLSSKDILPGVNELLKAIKKYDIKISIGSSSKNARYILEKIGLIDMFDVIVDGNDISKSKPDPEVFIKARTKLNAIDSECIVFEDAVSGIEAANSANCISVAVGEIYNIPIARYGYKSIEEVDIVQLFKI